MIKDIGYLEILKTNPGSSIQDLGRLGQSQWGIPIAGVMDQSAFHLLNHLLKNKPNDAVIELLQPGFTCRFDSYTTIGFVGAVAEIRKNGELTSSTILKICPGDKLEIGRFEIGSILYLGIKGGFQTEKVLDSRSFYPKITSSSQLSKGDQIPFFTNQAQGNETFASVKTQKARFEEEQIEVYPGPDFRYLSNENQRELLESKFTVSTLANRMAFQLEELLPNEIPERLTAPVYPGTVQLTSGGKIILLMRDAQVTGGYPRILHVGADSLAALAQKKTGQQIKFLLKNFPG